MGRASIRGAIAIVALAGLVTAGCSSSSSTSGSGGGTKATTTTTAAGGSDGVASNTVWLCKPGLANNPCEGDLSSTLIGADGTHTNEPARPAANPPIDCFYVYPTVSIQKGVAADLTIDPEETSVARAQAARFSTECRVFAPMYRQITVSGIFTPGKAASARVTAYEDVLNAWKDYLAHYNKGRGVVLIGHSQGAGMLNQLVREQFDNNAANRKLLVAADLIGGNVTVPIGKDVGGDFANIPACRAFNQVGCVVAYSSFKEVPPDNSLFGRPRAGLGGPVKPNTEVLCVNPANPAGGPAPLHPYLPVKVEGLVGGITTVDPSITTPWIGRPGSVTGECQKAAGASFLMVTPVSGDSVGLAKVTNRLGANWGLHLIDVNVALGDLVMLVHQEAAAYHS